MDAWIDDGSSLPLTLLLSLVYGWGVSAAQPIASTWNQEQSLSMNPLTYPSLINWYQYELSDLGALPIRFSRIHCILGRNRPAFQLMP